MDNKVFVVLMLLLGCAAQIAWTQTTTVVTEWTTENTDTTDMTEPTEAPFSSCFTYEGTEVDLEGLSGIWFETARAPDVDDSQCLNITLPATANAENKLELQVEYVDTSNDQWKPAKESSLLPWDDNAKQGIFTWSIGEVSQMPGTYKLVSTDKTSYAFFCGYMGIAPVPLFKILTRDRHLTVDQQIIISTKFIEMGHDAKLAWVEQSIEKCDNSGMRAAGGAIVALAFALLVFRRDL